MMTALDTKTVRKLATCDNLAYKVLDAYFAARLGSHGILARIIPSGFQGAVIDADSKAVTGLGSIASFSTEDTARTVIRILERKHRV